MNTYSDFKKDKIKRLSHQLDLSEQMLKNNPLVNKDLTLLQTVLHYLSLQLRWSSVAAASRLLITFKMVLQGNETAQSATGFIGPHLNQMFKAIAQLMKSSLNIEQRDLIDLLDTFNQLFFLGTFYISSQLLDNWKRLFPQHDPAAAFKAGLLLKELGLTFVLGSHAVDLAYQAVTKGLKINEKNQKTISDLGISLILGLLIFSEDENNSSNEEFIKTIQRFIYPALHSLESSIQEQQFQGIIEDGKAALILAQLQLIQQAIEKEEIAALKQILKESCDIFGFSYEGLIKDLKQVIDVCSQLNNTFKNIFYQSQQRLTTLTQSA